MKFRVGGGKLEYGESVAKAFEEEYGVPVEVEEAGMDIVNKMTLMHQAEMEQMCLWHLMMHI